MFTQWIARSFARPLRVWLIAGLLAGMALAAISNHLAPTALAQSAEDGLGNTAPSATFSIPNSPTYSYSLSPTSATTSTYRVTLTIGNCQGVTPPSSKWYGPGGQVNAGCGGGQVIREYT